MSFVCYGSEISDTDLQIFVGGLDPIVTEELLRQVFSPYGELVYVKIPVGKRCGFVQFAARFACLRFCAFFLWVIL